MKANNKIYRFLFIGFLFLTISCDRNNGVDCCDEPLLRIYKMKGDYIKNVCIGLTDDKTRILVYPGPTDNCGDPGDNPYTMLDGYYLDGCCNYGLNSAYLSITKEEYQEIFPISKDSMMKLILDSDPYLEYYLDENHLLGIKEPPDTTPYFTLDTAWLNEIIINKELDKYFTKLK